MYSINYSLGIFLQNQATFCMYCNMISFGIAQK